MHTGFPPSAPTATSSRPRGSPDTVCTPCRCTGTPRAVQTRTCSNRRPTPHSPAPAPRLPRTQQDEFRSQLRQAKSQLKPPSHVPAAQIPAKPSQKQP
eukprot:1681939-Rhodomonas_salina.1